MRLIATRHAETNYNIENLVNYDPSVDVHLTEKGIQQAKELAEELKGFKFDKIYISRLPRTKQTAEFINKFHNLPLIENELLDDVRNGFEGRSYVEAKGWRNAQPDPVMARYQNKFESVADMTNRVRKFLQYLHDHHGDNETILIVTSSHIIKQLRLLNHEITLEELMGNAPAVHAKYYVFDFDTQNNLRKDQ